MFVLRALFVAALAAPNFAQSLSYIDQLRYVTNDGVVYTIQPNATFTVPTPGHLKGRVTYATTNYDASSGHYIQPNLAAMWSVRNSDFGWVGPQEWLGDDENQAPLPTLSFDVTTGIGQAEFDAPMAHFIGANTYAPLPQGGTTIVFAFGTYGALHLGSGGLPVNFQHYAFASFDTDYPDLLVSLDSSLVEVGGRIEITMIMEDSVPYDRQLNVNVIGTAQLQFEDGGPINSWSLAIPAGTRSYVLDLIGIDSGSFYVRADLDGTVIAASQAGQISELLPSLADEEGSDGFTDEGSNDNDSDNTNNGEPQEMKICRPGSCVPADGDKEINCTRPFVELVEPPINPNCGADIKGYLKEGGCFKGNQTCRITGSERLNCPKYKYAGTVDRSSGQVEVGMKVGAEGGANFFFFKGKLNVEGSVTVMSPITRRCCKFVPVPGETAPVRTPTCSNDM